MSVSRVEIAAGSKLQALAGRDALGTHYLEKTWSSLWFDFDESGLTSIVAARIVGLKNSDLKQRHNPCRGQVTSLVMLYLADGLVGATITLDGIPVTARRRQQAFFFDLAPGNHKIAVAKGDHVALKRVEVTLGGPGEIRLSIAEAELAKSQEAATITSD